MILLNLVFAEIEERLDLSLKDISSKLEARSYDKLPAINKVFNYQVGDSFIAIKVEFLAKENAPADLSILLMKKSAPNAVSYLKMKEVLHLSGAFEDIIKSLEETDFDTLLEPILVSILK